MESPENIRLLYLAKYAPYLDSDPVPNVPDMSYAEYHRGVYRILKERFPKMISSPDYMHLVKNYPNNDVDFVFSLYNRMPFRNCEIFISSLAECERIPFLGASPNIRAIAEDKHMAKVVASHLGINTPEWKIYNIGDKLSPPDFDGPYFIKPRFGATSIHIDEYSQTVNWDEAILIIKKLHDMGDDVILERMIFGTQYSLPYMYNFGKEIFLPAVEEKSDLRGNVITYNQKRMIEGGLRRVAVDDQKINSKLVDFSKKLLRIVRPIDYARFDYIIDDKTKVAYFIEFNICCNLGRKSAFALSSEHTGINYESLILNVVYSSLYRSRLIDAKDNEI